jgi:enoyl-CoA hydratase/carnithine racemase
MPLLRCEIEQGLATIVLNNPPQNRLTPQMVDELCEFVNVVGKSEARAVLLYAEGPDFSFGGRHRAVAGNEPSRTADAVRALSVGVQPIRAGASKR